MSNVNLDKLTPVTKNFSKKSQSSDLRFSQTQEKFFVNDEPFAKWDLENHGFMLQYDSNSGRMFLAVLPHEDAVMFKGRPDKNGKNPEFQSSEFQKHLKIFGWLPEDEEQDLELNLVDAGKNSEGVQFLEVVRAEDQEDPDVPAEETEQTNTEETVSEEAPGEEDNLGINAGTAVDQEASSFEEGEDDLVGDEDFSL